VPKGVIRRIAGRYIAGESIDQLLRVLAALEAKGLGSTVDVLGENVTSEQDARAARDEYLRLVERLSGSASPREVSVKLTLLGLRVDEGFLRESLEKVVGAAQERKISVCLDMEDSSTTEATIRTFRWLRERHAGVSMAIQAYLHRSVEDLKSLLPLRPSLRICKGIYNEPPGIAFQDRRPIQENYLKLLDLLLDGGGYPAIATHDAWLISKALEGLKARGLGTSTHEFQMLLGVGEALWGKILEFGSPLRLYCPYGPDWYAYSLRRLRENPRMGEYILKSLFSRKILKAGYLK
jgi:proline dehydrogenase